MRRGLVVYPTNCRRAGTIFSLMYRGPTAANMDTLLPALGTVEALKPEGLSGQIFPLHYFDILGKY